MPKTCYFFVKRS